MGLTSDRAKALVKLGKEEYLNTVSMPDLFHFAQDISRAVGCRLGRKKAQLQKAHDECTATGPKASTGAELAKVAQCQESYRQQMRQVNKTVHPFDSEDRWRPQGGAEESLSQCFTEIASIANGAGIEIEACKAAKVRNQIPDIAAGIQAWQEHAQGELRAWDVPGPHRQWAEECALPYAYWQLQLNKTQAKARNEELRGYYKQRAKDAQERYEQHSLTAELGEEARQDYLGKAFRIAATFQRASSQVEGRNGYLSFVHRAHRGIPKQRLAVLTVVHNFDIRRGDGTTPAERLFSRPFPDLFEFLCQNVTGFAEPRRRRREPQCSKAVQP